jgi:hypothetical protein
MKILIKINLLFLFGAILFSGCEKESFEEIVPEIPGNQVDMVEVNPLVSDLNTTSSDFIMLDCIRIPFPVDFLQASGNTITVNSEAELDAAAMLSDSIVDFIYPFEVFNDDDVTIVIEEVEDLVVALTDCVIIDNPDDNSGECDHFPTHASLFYNAFNIFTINQYDFEVEFPFTLIVEGNEVVVNNQDEYIPAIGGNPSRFLGVEIVYPVTITQFGQQIVLNNDDEVCEFTKTLSEECENKPAHIQFFYNEGGGMPSNCAYFIDYPVEITLDGTTIQIQDPEQYRAELNASPGAYADIELVYPVTIYQFEDYDKITFQQDSDICDYLENLCEYR